MVNFVVLCASGCSGSQAQVFSIWATRSCRFATSAFICKHVTDLLFHGAGVSGLGFIEVCSPVSLQLEMESTQMCGLIISVMIARLFGCRWQR